MKIELARQHRPNIGWSYGFENDYFLPALQPRHVAYRAHDRDGDHVTRAVRGD